LLALDRLVRERRDALFADLERDWRAGGVEVLGDEVGRVVARLESRAGGRVETERKYLLSEVPPAARQGTAVEILQGWLPGERLRERIRRIRSEGAVRYLRALKQGVGLRRLESEEETPQEVFEVLWPLTEGRRIEKRRWTVRDGATAWEVDEFLDRGLVLAEVELPPQAADTPLPEWLRPYLVREVTGDPEYLNENLARAGSARASEATGKPGAAPERAAEVAPGPARARGA
jgi:CYTH domain-containing protein